MKALRLFFFALILANLLLFFWNRGHFGTDDEGRESQRLTEQKAADKLHILADTAAPDEVPKTPALSATDTLPAPPPPPPTVAAIPSPDKVANKSAPQVAEKPIASCRLLTGFKLAEARLWVAANSARLPDSKFSVSPTGPVANYDILIPALAGREAADNKQREIRALGIGLPLRTIADGADKLALVFTSVASEAEARDYLQALQEKGVRSARIIPRIAPSAPAQIEIRNLDAARGKTLVDLLASRNDIRAADCPTR